MIDKAYTLMYGLDRLNRIAQFSPLAKWDTKENIYKSLDLPLPKKDKILITDIDKLEGLNYYHLDNILEQILLQIKGTNIEQELIKIKKEGLKQEFKIVNGELVSVEQSEEQKQLIDLMDVELDIMDISNYITLNLDLLNILLKSINESNYPIYTTNLDLAEIINSHQLFTPSKTAYQNKVTRNIYLCSHNILNLEYSIQPMSMDIAKEKISIVSQFMKEHGYKAKDKINIDPENPGAIGIIREQNGMGKVEVGVFANGIKVNSSLQQYFNKYKVKFEPLKLKFNFKELNEKDSNFNEFIELVSEKNIDSIANLLGQENIEELLALTENEQQNLQENVADKLSVLISLATDNAKELKLYIMNSTPQLAKMYVALFTLGYTWEEALKIGMILFEPIIQKLKANRFVVENSYNEDAVLQTIIQCKSEGIFDVDTANSLIQVLKFANEMTGLSAFFKINQGIAARYEEAINFSSNLGKILKSLVKDAEKKNIAIPEEFKYPFDLYKFCYNEHYRQRLIAFNEQVKTALNSFDIIYKTNHFFSQAKSFAKILMILNTVSIKADFVYNLRTPQITVQEDGVTIVNKNKKSIRYDRMKLRQQLNIPEHVVLSRILSNLSKYKFTVKQLKDYLGISINNLSDYPDNFVVDLSTKDGVSIFVDMMNNIIIPRLKNTYPNNQFLMHLIKMDNHEFNKSLYDLNVSYFDVDNIDQYRVRSLIQTDFIKDVAMTISGLNNIKNESITYGELLYLYNLIVYRNKLGGLNTVTKQILEYDPNLEFLDLYIEAYSYYDNLDIIERQKLFEEMQDLLHVSASRSKKGTYSKGNTELDLSQSYVFYQEYTQTKLNEIFSSKKTLEDFIDEINKSLGDDHNFILELNC